MTAKLPSFSESGARQGRRHKDRYQQDLNVLLKVVETLSLELDFKKVGDYSTQVAMQMVGADICGLALPAGENHLSYQFIWGLAPGTDETPLRKPFPINTGAASSVFKQGQGAFFPDYPGYPDHIPAIAALGVRTVFAAPVTVAGSIVGVLSIAWYQTVPCPEKDKVVLLEVVLRQIGIAYHRHQLMAKLSQSEAETKAINERLRRILAVSPVVIYSVVYDLASTQPNLKIDFLSDNVKDLLGYRRETIFANPNFWYEMVHPEDLPSIALKNNPEAIARGAFDRTYRMRHQEGHYVWIQDSLRIFSSPGEKSLEIVGGWMDITQRKQAEIALREAEEKYRCLVEQSIAGIYIVQEGRFTYANPKLAEIFGYTREELVGVIKVQDLVYAEDWHIVAENMRKRLEGHGPAYPYWFRGICKDKTIVDVEVHGALIRFSGKPAIIGMAVDITERRQAEMARLEAEAKYRSLIEQSMVGVYIVQNNRFTYVNPKLAEIFGYSSEELLAAESVFEFVPEDYRAIVQENFRKRFSGEVKSVQYYFKIRRKDKTVVDVEAHGSLAILNGIPSIIGMGFDITERKKAEAELLRHRAHLEELVTEQTADLIAAKTIAEEAKDEADLANQAKSRLLASASHDLRQPMHALGLLVAALRRRVQFSDAETEKIMRHIESSVETMDNLFSALLDISKLDAGIINPVIRPYPMSMLLERLKAEFGEETSQKNLRFIVHSCKKVVRCDPALLERIIRNFISNAVRYTESGGVLVGCRPRGQNLEIQVWDMGPGIPTESKREIFQEFYQLNNPERDRNKGLGLGLAIVDRLSRLLGYIIRVESRLGRGTMFSVLVPMETNVQISTQLPALKIATVFPDAKIIVIDDELINAEAMQTLLEEWGCKVVIASSLKDAVVKLEQTWMPDLIISDYHLREKETGTEVINGLRRHFNVSLPGILITGDTTPMVLKEAEAGGFRLLHKPALPAKLRALMAFVLTGIKTAKEEAAKTLS